MAIPCVDGPFRRAGQESFFVSGTGDGFSTDRAGLVALIESAKQALAMACECRDHQHQGKASERCTGRIGGTAEWAYRCRCGEIDE